VFVLLYFALTLFTSATLLFLVQPMIGKMILPLLGGTPAVWNTCMVFFQGVLLAGYAYTHFVSTRLSRRAQLFLQAALLLGPFVFLPFSLGSWTPPADSNPIFSVLWILTIVVGVPFFVVSTTAPLLQKWFGFTGHPAAKDPYFLYGASNFGSMLALVLYPLMLEPTFAIPEQTIVWTVGYGVFAALVLGCIGMLLLRERPAFAEAPAEPLPPQPAVANKTAIAPRPQRQGLRPAEPAPKLETPDIGMTWLRRVRWIALAAIPSSLMLSLTTYMTTDIAAIPFFWVIPLGIYLFTFILVFARWPVVWTAPAAPRGPRWLPSFFAAGAVLCLFVGFAIHVLYPEYRDPRVPGPSHIFYVLAFLGLFAFWVTQGIGSPHEFVLFFQPCFLLFLLLYIVSEVERKPWLDFILHVSSFAFVTLLCHGELARDRPRPEHLTDFYLCMSVGGVLGGLFNVLVAPFVFRYGLYEYPLVMVAACLLRPFMVGNETFIPGDSREAKTTRLGWVLDLAMPLAIAAAVYYIVRIDLADGALAFLHRIDPRWNPETMERWPALRPLAITLPIVGVLALALRPIRFGLSVGLLWLVVSIYDDADQKWTFRDRGFFGLVKVKLVEARVSGTPFAYNTLIHGGIDHGRQHVEPSKRNEPCSYFHPLTGIGQIFMKLTWPNTPLPASLDELYSQTSRYSGFSRVHQPIPAFLVGAGCDPWTALVATQSRPPTFDNPYSVFAAPNQRLPVSLIGAAADPWTALVATQAELPYAVVGLGTGTLAAYAQPYQAMDIYEIDPLVLRLSQRVGDKEPPFTYLEDAKNRGANLNVILGDGRLKIKNAPEHWYHVICLDAFASDAIPVHLLTVEAIQAYLDKLAPGGVLVFNTTNRYIRLNGVLKDAADALDLECLALGNWYTKVIPEQYGTDFVMLRRKPTAIAKLGGPFNGGPPLAERLDLERYKSLMSNVSQFRNGHDFASQETWSWRPWREPENHNGKLWTDSYSNLLGVLDLGN
jgi:SAM-dependent methyltransferase